MDVLPTSVEPPATTRMRIVSARGLTPSVSELSVSAGTGGEALGAGEAFAGVERGGADQVLAAQGRGEASADRLVGRAAVAADAVRREGRDRGGEGFGFVACLAARPHAGGPARRGGFPRGPRAGGGGQIERAPPPPHG